MSTDNFGAAAAAASGTAGATRRSYDVVVIGGGITGAGLARDLAMRGMRCLLVEQGELTHGTTGRFHGLLHSGARYAVKDPTSAAECIAENRVLRRIASQCVEDTGGFSCLLPGDPEDYPTRFVDGCARAGIDVREIDVAAAIAREPQLSHRVVRVFEVPDATVDPFSLVAANVLSATEHGAEVWTQAEVVGLRTSAGRVVAVDIVDARDGGRHTVETGGVVSAAGAWAARVLALAGIQIAVAPGWGVMVIMNERLANTVMNRCRMPADADLILPVGTVSIAGTTSRTVESPDSFEISREEVLAVITGSSEMIPALMHARVLRVYAGARPLYDPSQEKGSSRSLSRAHTVLDHANAGVDNLVSIVGGKLTTYRLMAQQTADVICAKLGNTRPCRTADEPLPGAEAGRHYSVGGRFAANEDSRAGADADLVCECEMVTRASVESCVAATPAIRLDGMLRALRLGMGPCQGAYCSLRATGILARANALDGQPPLQPLRDFLEERFKGSRPILWGDQARQLAVNEIIYREVFNLDHVA